MTISAGVFYGKGKLFWGVIVRIYLHFYLIFTILYYKTTIEYVFYSSIMILSLEMLSNIG